MVTTNDVSISIYIQVFISQLTVNC